mmetsp:Transcript_130/g.413  ORF Transcript_130/g.413 Transcript_130/m.413 type:complete len:200 (+) Transcript_130:133-732(+)
MFKQVQGHLAARSIPEDLRRRVDAPERHACDVQAHPVRDLGHELRVDLHLRNDVGRDQGERGVVDHLAGGVPLHAQLHGICKTVHEVCSPKEAAQQRHNELAELFLPRSRAGICIRLQCCFAAVEHTVNDGQKGLRIKQRRNVELLRQAVMGRQILRCVLYRQHLGPEQHQCLGCQLLPFHCICRGSSCAGLLVLCFDL